MYDLGAFLIWPFSKISGSSINHQSTNQSSVVSSRGQWRNERLDRWVSRCFERCEWWHVAPTRCPWVYSMDCTSAGRLFRAATDCFNPLMVTLKPEQRTTTIQQYGDWYTGCGPAQSPPRCTKCNSPPINGQCTTNFKLFDVALYHLYTIKG